MKTSKYFPNAELLQTIYFVLTRSTNRRSAVALGIRNLTCSKLDHLSTQSFVKLLQKNIVFTFACQLQFLILYKYICTCDISRPRNIITSWRWLAWGTTPQLPIYKAQKAPVHHLLVNPDPALRHLDPARLLEGKQPIGKAILDFGTIMLSIACIKSSVERSIVSLVFGYIKLRF